MDGVFHSGLKRSQDSNNMKNFFICFGLFLQFCGSYAFIIPDELPSLLSVIYSNIPTIKKGTDSRLGWGFRLGDRADFQILVELGPQMYTQPLANQGGTGNSKRNTIDNLANTLYAQRQQEKKKNKKQSTKKSVISNTPGGKWLETWKKDLTQTTEVPDEDLPLQPRPGLGIGEIDAKSVIPSDSIIKLEELRLKQRQVKTISKPENLKSESSEQE